MKTVPKPQLSHGENHEITWDVKPSNFPFGAPNKTIGQVSAADKRTAQSKAEDLYGRDVVVERVLRNAENAGGRNG